MGVFSIFTTKKHKPNSTPKPSERFTSYATVLRYIKYILVTITIVYVAVGLMFFGEYFSVENFRYMFKFISVNADSTVVSGSYISIDVEDDAKALLIDGDLALTDTNGTQVFDLLGERYLRVSSYQSDPMCVTNGSDLIVCGRGGYELNIYSVYMLLYSNTFSYPVYDLVGSDSGYYAVLTASKGYRSGIEVYDGDYRIKFTYYFADRYISGIGLANDGKKAAACTITNTEDGAYLGELYIFDSEKTDKSGKVGYTVTSYPDEIPWKIHFNSDGSYYFLTNKAVRVFDANENPVATIEFGEHNPKDFTFTDNYIILALSEAGLSDTTLVRYYNKNGDFIGEQTYRNDVSEIDVADDYAFVFSVGTLHTVYIPSVREVQSEYVGLTYVSALFDQSNQRIIFTYNDRAKMFDLADYLTS